MKSQRRSAFLVVALVFLLSWGCSSSKVAPKTTTNPPAPVQKNQPTEPPPQDKPQVEEAPLQAPEQPEMAPEAQVQEAEPLTGKEEPPVILEEALNTYQEALTAWEKGDWDAAFDALDEAYGLILKVDLPPDSPLAQEKNDLRLLIAQRIQQIYASRPVAIGDNHKTIPVEEKKEVLDEVRSFQTKERDQFLDAYRRSGLYRDLILEELRKEGLPEELSWLPLIESGFKVRALSRARALGMWQFISSTGYRYGLKRDRYIDERMDFLKATQAAVRYLIELHSFFGDWSTALAAYNCGEARVQSVIRTQQIDYLDNFWDLYRQLPWETARFVPRFQATLLIINSPEKYGFELPPPEPPLQFDSVPIEQPFKLSALAASLGVETAVLSTLNPELRYDSTPAYAYILRVPPGCGEKCGTLVAAGLPKWIPPEAQYTWHYVRSGETLSTIAARYRTSVSAIARLNGLRSVHFIKPGQRLKIPGRGGAVISSAGSEPPGAGNSGAKIAYTVKAGDTPYSIARGHAMSLEEFLALNGIESPARIFPGQQLWVLPRD
jgi:membrane-bound lytic murein transglycosylase D